MRSTSNKRLNKNSISSRIIIDEDRLAFGVCWKQSNAVGAKAGFASPIVTTASATAATDGKPRSTTAATGMI